MHFLLLPLSCPYKPNCACTHSDLPISAVYTANMKYSTLLASALAAFTSAAPTAKHTKRADLDITVLQFALTLEHLENNFYHGVLDKFSAEDFEKAGYSMTYYNNLKHIAFDEQTHVTALQQAIQAAGTTPVAACTYKFPYTDVASFITLSSVLEGVGTSAYLGGAPLITSKEYLTTAGSILVTEALHTSYQRAAKGEVPFPMPFGTPLDPMSVFSLAAAFITACPSSNPALPFTAFPSLTYNASSSCTCEEPDCSPHDAIKRRDDDWSPWQAKNGPPKDCSPPSAGATITLTAGKPISPGSYVTFVSGLSIMSVQGTISGDSVSVAIPSNVAGQAYVLITNSKVEGQLNDSAVLFGPAIVEVNPAAPVINDSIQ